MPRAVGGYKICSQCNQEKPVSEFGKQSSKFDGYEYACLICSRKRKADYKQRNRDKILKWQREYNSREHVKLGRKNYKNTVKGKVAIAKINHKRREAAENAKEKFTYKHYNFLMEVQQGCCAKCHRKFTEKLKVEIDHVLPVSKGGTTSFENIQLLCKSCNVSKGTKHIRYIPDVVMTFFV